MIDTPTVLVVDQQIETCEVLRTIFSRRGISVLEARHTDDGLQLAMLHQPEVVVLDIDQHHPAESSIIQQFQDVLSNENSSIVVLSSTRQAEVLEDQFIRKPYQYGPLVDMIESMLEKFYAQGFVKKQAA